MPPIRLHDKHTVSPVVDIDLLTELQKNIINRSIQHHEICLLDADNKQLKGSLKDVNMINGNFVSTEDIEEEPETLPDMVSVTVGGETEETEVEEDGAIKEEFFDEARILLKRNGNTIKKSLLALNNTDDNLMLLHACYEEEEKGKNRNGVLTTIQSKISEY